MHHPGRLLLGVLLLYIFHREWQLVAGECIDLEQHSQEIASCCKLEPAFGPVISDKCVEATSSRTPVGSPEFLVCFLNCAFHEMGVLQGEDAIDVEKYNSFQASYDATYREVMANAVASCAAIQEDIRRDLQGVSSSCNGFAIVFHVCVTQQAIQNCPNDRWSTSDPCRKLREGVPICEN